MATTARIGPLVPRHRARLDEILRATGVFRAEEVEVALELFDEGCGVPDGEAAGVASPYGRVVPSTQHVAPSTSSYVFLGAFTPEDELVGYACYGPTPGTDRTFDLYWIVVHPSAQGTGSGTILLDEVERTLRDMGARMLIVETSSRSEYASTRRFYRARGYAEAARMRDFYAPADDRIILTKRFHSSAAGREGGAGHDE